MLRDLPYSNIMFCLFMTGSINLFLIYPLVNKTQLAILALDTRFMIMVHTNCLLCKSKKEKPKTGKHKLVDSNVHGFRYAKDWS